MRELPYKVVTNRLGHDAEKWCVYNIGNRWSFRNRSGNWTCHWVGLQSPKQFYWFFRNEQDAFLFSLRWL